MRNFPVKTFKYGVINNIEAQSIPDGAASDSLNWITKGSKIELSRGMKLLGSEVPGTGRVSAIHPGKKADGTEVLFIKRGRKISYYDTTTEDWIEVGTNIIPAAAEDEDVTFSNFDSLAGAQTWLNSPNGTLIKIMTANPGSYADMYDSSKNFKGWIKIKQNRMFLWGRKEDQTGIYGSYIDAQAYTTVTAEATTSLTGTLAFKAGGAKRTCFGVTLTITATGEVYTDDYNGVLTGSLGGTGTINYMTGAYTVSNPGVGTVDYQWENSTNTGIADFSKATPRQAAQGFIFRQDDGGGATQNVFSYGDSEFCLHKLKSWNLTLTATDTSATNLIFRDKVGIPFLRAGESTGDGIYYIDDTDQTSPRFKLLTLSISSSEVIPKDVTLNINLENYRFDKGVMFEWGDYIVFAGRHKDSSANNRLFIYSKIWKSIDIRDYYVSCLATYNGSLIAGDSVSDNVYVLFSGFDDDDSLIENYWIGNITGLGLDRLKKMKKFKLQGEIVPNQSFDVYLNIDNSGFVNVGTVSGNGSYVDRGQSIAVGAVTIGRYEVGGGSGDAVAYNYETEISLRLDKFENVQVKYVATGIGYVSISEAEYRDIRANRQKTPRKYRNS